MRKDEADAWIQRRAQGMEVIGELTGGLTSHRPDHFTAIGELADWHVKHLKKRHMCHHNSQKYKASFP